MLIQATAWAKLFDASLINVSKHDLRFWSSSRQGQADDENQEPSHDPEEPFRGRIAPQNHGRQKQTPNFGPAGTKPISFSVYSAQRATPDLGSWAQQNCIPNVPGNHFHSGICPPSVSCGAVATACLPKNLPGAQQRKSSQAIKNTTDQNPWTQLICCIRCTKTVF